MLYHVFLRDKKMFQQVANHITDEIELWTGPPMLLGANLPNEPAHTSYSGDLKCSQKHSAAVAPLVIASTNPKQVFLYNDKHQEGRKRKMINTGKTNQGSNPWRHQLLIILIVPSIRRWVGIDLSLIILFGIFHHIHRYFLDIFCAHARTLHTVV